MKQANNNQNEKKYIPTQADIEIYKKVERYYQTEGLRKIFKEMPQYIHVELSPKLEQIILEQYEKFLEYDLAFDMQEAIRFTIENQ